MSRQPMRGLWLSSLGLLIVLAGMVICLRTPAKYVVPGLIRYLPVQWIVTDLHSQDETLRVKASLWIGEHPHLSDVTDELIVAAKTDPTAEVRRNALIALSLHAFPHRFSRDEYVAFLDALARDDPSPQVRRTAANMRTAIISLKPEKPI